MRNPTIAASLFLAGAALLGTCRADSVRVVPERVQAGKSLWILAKGNPQAKVHFEIESGTECGDLNPKDAQTNDQGEAKSVFTAYDPPASCKSTIKTVIARSKDVDVSDAGNQAFIRTIEVFPTPVALVASVDATTAITILLIASFAIDRMVALFMFLVPLAKVHGEQDPELLKRRERLIYVALAGVLGLLLGYFGEIRLLAGFGFSSNVALNVIVTALVLTAGSESISALLKKMGSGSLGEAEPKPLIVRGDLTLTRPEHRGAATARSTSNGGATERN